MKIRAVIAVACLALFGFTQVADARSHHVRRHTVKKTIRSSQGGVNTSTTDVNGDGTSAVVVAPKPRRRPSGAVSGGGVSVQ